MHNFCWHIFKANLWCIGSGKQALAHSSLNAFIISDYSIPVWNKIQFNIRIRFSIEILGNKISCPYHFDKKYVFSIVVLQSKLYVTRDISTVRLGNGGIHTLVQFFNKVSAFELKRKTMNTSQCVACTVCLVIQLHANKIHVTARNEGQQVVHKTFEVLLKCSPCSSAHIT